MSILPAGRSSSEFFPDLGEFLLDPNSYLTSNPVLIGPGRAYGFAALFAALGGACIASCIISGVWHDERLLLGIGFLIAGSVWLGWSLRLRGHSLVLRPDGVEIRFLQTTVWCPWALFNADGSPFVPADDDPQVGVVLPISRAAVPFIELRRNDSLVAQGVQVSAPQFRLVGSDQVVLPARYELATADLASLLLQLGSRLGRRLPPGSPPPEAFATAHTEANEIVGPDREGWYTIPLDKLHFPRRCCDCLQPTDAVVRCSIDDGHLAAQLTGLERQADLTIPLCVDCQAAIRDAYRRSGIRGLNAGVLLGLFGMVALFLSKGERKAVLLAIAALAGTAIGGLIGFLIGNGLTRPMPLRFRHYQADTGTLQVRFRDPHYADLMFAGVDSRRSSR